MIHNFAWHCLCTFWSERFLSARGIAVIACLCMPGFLFAQEPFPGTKKPDAPSEIWTKGRASDELPVYHKAYEAISNFKKDYEAPAIEHLKLNAKRFAGKYLLDEQTWMQILVLGMIPTDKTSVLMPYLEMRSPADTIPPDVYYYSRYPAIEVLVKAGSDSISPLYRELRAKELSDYRLRLVVMALIQINFVEGLGYDTDEDLEIAKTRTLALFESCNWRGIPQDRNAAITKWIDDYYLSADLPEEIPGLIPEEILEKMKLEREGRAKEALEDAKRNLEKSQNRD